MDIEMIKKLRQYWGDGGTLIQEGLDIILKAKTWNSTYIYYQTWIHTHSGIERKEKSVKQDDCFDESKLLGTTERYLHFISYRIQKRIGFEIGLYENSTDRKLYIVKCFKYVLTGKVFNQAEAILNEMKAQVPISQKQLYRVPLCPDKFSGFDYKSRYWDIYSFPH